MLARYGVAAEQDARTRAAKPGRRPVPRLALNAALVRTLQAAGVPLSISRAGLVHKHLHHCVCKEPQLSNKDLFAAVQQGITVVTKGFRLRTKQVL